MKDRSGWARTGIHKNLVKFTRTCATCGTPFSIFVTQKIADGLADTNNFGLRNCEQHRRGLASKLAREAENNLQKFPWNA